MGPLIGLGDVALLLSRVLPRRWLYALARLQGLALYLASGDSRRRVTANLAPFAAGRRELARMTRRFFELRQIRMLMIILALQSRPEAWDEMVAIDGIEHLDDALDKGRGAVLLGSHLNSVGIFITIMILRRRGYDVGVALPSDEDLFPATRFGAMLRRRSNAASLKELIGGFYVQFNVRPIVRYLTRNGVVGQTGDGWHSAAFVEVPFLGRTLPFTTGMMSVAQSIGAAVVPFHIEGDAPHLRCVISPPMVVPEDDADGSRLEAAVGEFVAGFETALRDNLLAWEHWLIPDTLESMASWPDRPLQERLDL